ncbi:P-type DNA transfer ATPase VirB11 [Escherichia coli]|uniref:P-type DNA transfer ATPase VirB11 n=1 Tax=Escherichia coli TaxID=562 RepID=UPI00070C7148|nr:P-type DNA transfer ATPase VirB11 [Escherichia coli]EES7211990.1 P-type DNA transfer ATPase VirB11 [Escherichia coli]EES7571342.1 P-type DNA transfer ATPase VirB11 [Escherichia coli]EET9056608.1 P-type DNA transfer ATPase VirB11 [Escherichia coli]EEV1043744.1 P-type DNA transfer ATPase VirB11 [Escherichia coli]EEW2745093.1 P-type DNA transfer ATPase VirB11 [Escherichia coli]
METINMFLESTGVQPFLEAEGLTEIIVNRPFEIITESVNGWEYHEAPGASYSDLLDLSIAINKYNNSAEPLDALHPIKSLVMPGGERMQIIMPPACEERCISFTIRKPSLRRFTLEDYVNSNRFSNVRIVNQANLSALSASQQTLLDLLDNTRCAPRTWISFLEAAVAARMNILVVGGTGSGKTTIAKTIADLFPRDRRIITIEDVHEMTLPNHRNHVHLFYKQGGVQPRYLIEAAMRMKPDHIFLAELRGDEAWSYLEALNTGHEGSVTTIHANSALDAISRLASIVKQSTVGLTLDHSFILKTIKTSIDIVVFFRHTHMTEIYYNPMEKNQLLAA